MKSMAISYNYKQEMYLKKTNGVGLKKGKSTCT